MYAVRSVLISSVLLGTLGLISCQRQGSQESGVITAQAAQQAFFEVSPDQLAHLQVSPVQRATWPVSIHTTGTVDWDEDNTTQAITQVNGPVSRILVEPAIDE